MKPEAARKAAIYCRISKDRDGQGLGVDRQESDCRALAKRLGLTVAAVFVDNDISASTRSTKVRPQYEEMLRRVRGGGIDAILAYSNSRLTRRPMQWIELIALAESGRVRIETVASGKHDLSTADGRASALTVAAWDAAEAERTGERVARQKAQAAASGAYRGGPRPYGYNKNGTTLRKREAEIIERMTREVLAGRTLSALARELNDAGEVTSVGRPWTYQRLRDVLIRPRNAGLVSTGRPDRGDDFTILGHAVWPAIVDEDTWRAVHTLLVDPARRKQRGNATRWLLSGIASCGLCGSALRAAPHGGTASRPQRRRFMYRCTETAHLTIDTDHTDEHVRIEIAALIRQPEVIEALTERGDDTMAADRERRSVLMTRLGQIETDYDRGLIDGVRFKKASDTVVRDIEEVEARLADAAQAATILPVFTEADPAARFLVAPVDVQREVLRAVATVTVNSATRRGDRWKPDRVRITPLWEAVA